MKEGWTYKKLEACIDKVPKQKQVKSKDYQSFGKFPIVSQEKDLISGYWDDESFVFKHTKPIVIFGDHTKEIKYIDFDFVVGADGTQILYPKEDVDTKFFYYALLATPLRTLGYARHFKLLKEKSFPIPPLSEQQTIVSRLDAAIAQIDALKANAGKQLDEARKLFQKALEEAMKPKEGWKEKTLKEIGLTQTGTTPSKADANNYGDYIPFIRPSEIDIDDCGSIDYDSEIKLSKRGLNVGRLFKKHSILMVCIGATISKVGFCSQDVSCNQQINVLTPKTDYDYKFVYYAMRNKDFKNKVIKEGTSAQATLPIINKGKWGRLSIFCPSIEVQQKIVASLDALSANIKKLEEIQQKTITECDALKQAMLREVFE